MSTYPFCRIIVDIVTKYEGWMYLDLTISFFPVLIFKEVIPRPGIGI